MKVQLAHILQNIFHTSSLDEVPVNKLQEIVNDHPYFSAGHFFLAQRLQEQSAQYDEQLQKTALYFHDPLWLHWLLKQEEQKPVEKSIPLEAIDTARKAEGENINAVAPVESIAAIEPAEHVDIPGSTEEVEEFDEPETAQVIETAQFHEQEEEVPAEPEPFEIVEQPEAIEPAPETYANPVEPIQAEQVQTVEAIEADEPPQEVPPATKQTVVQIPGPAAIFKPTNESVPLAFDPYYTIDYFASQGIKVPMEVQPGDKLGKQLKSFTEWLKTMKRLPQAPAEAKTDDTEQQHIRQAADGSLEGKEVVTETMADVLIKQDRKDEAIAIYEKLSLLDPSKRAYFAAKIENLKEN
jgi:hypothetical protein